MDKNILTEILDQSEILLNRYGHAKHEKGVEFDLIISDFDIYYIISGSFTLFINSKKHHAKAGDMFLITPNTKLTLIANEYSEHFYQHFSVLYFNKINLIGDIIDHRLPSGQVKHYRNTNIHI